ncbi:hypothetical protein IWW45_009324 [Coemansia sp. RSA 485]|nr:hypothetical protein IWW45_009324 [Coemansia sp. RSA 485]
MDIASLDIPATGYVDRNKRCLCMAQNAQGRVERCSDRAVEAKAKYGVDNQIAAVGLLSKVSDKGNVVRVALEQEVFKQVFGRLFWVIENRSIPKVLEVAGSNQAIAAVVPRTYAK